MAKPKTFNRVGKILNAKKNEKIIFNYVPFRNNYNAYFLHGKTKQY